MMMVLEAMAVQGKPLLIARSTQDAQKDRNVLCRLVWFGFVCCQRSKKKKKERSTTAKSQLPIFVPSRFCLRSDVCPR
jgi:hypothetical protein